MTIQTAIKGTALSSRIDAMRLRHRRIDDRVAAEHRRPQPDMSVLQSLKREKLRLKDGLARYEGLLRTVARGRVTT